MKMEPTSREAAIGQMKQASTKGGVKSPHIKGSAVPVADPASARVKR